MNKTDKQIEKIKAEASKIRKKYYAELGKLHDKERVLTDAWEKTRERLQKRIVNLRGKTPKAGICEECHKVSIRKTLRQGWASIGGGEAELEWMCPTCYKKFGD